MDEQRARVSRTGTIELVRLPSLSWTLPPLLQHCRRENFQEKRLPSPAIHKYVPEVMAELSCALLFPPRFYSGSFSRSSTFVAVVVLSDMVSLFMADHTHRSGM